MRLTPSNVQAIGTDLAIVWHDGTESYLPLDVVRRSCPCASCNGEPDSQGNIAKPLVTYTSSSSELRAFAYVGGYAIQPTWGDGHRTGIYSFDYLRQLDVTLAADPGKKGMTLAVKIGLMLLVFAVCGSAILLTSRQAAPERPTVDPSALYEVIETQLTAFREADFPRAYRFASNAFQQKWNVDQFTDTVRIDYAALIRAERIEFGAAHVRDDRAIIQVFFIGRGGEVLPCIYSLINEGGVWRIEGARRLRQWAPGERLRGLRT